MIAQFSRFKGAIGLALLFSSAASVAAAEQAECRYDNGEVVRLGFTPSGQPLVEGALNEFPIQFLLDTGSSLTLPLRHKMLELRLPVSKETRRSDTGAGGALGMSITRLKSLRFGPVQLEKPYLFVLNNLHQKLQGNFDAILGMDSLMLSDFEVDIAAEKLVIYKGLCAAGSPVVWQEGAMTVEMNKNRPQTSPAQFTVTVKNRALKAVLDTGATVTDLDAKIAAELGIEEKEGSRRHAIGAGDQRAALWNATVSDIGIGNARIKSAELSVRERAPGGSGSEFLIGMDYLRNHRVLFLPSQGRILIKQNGTDVFTRKVARK